MFTSHDNLFNFSVALDHMKDGLSCSRKAWNNPHISVMVQRPDEHSKMTMPYLYMEKKIVGTNDEELVARFPLDLSAESIFADDWFITE